MATVLKLNSTEQEQWDGTGSPNHEQIDEGDPENEADSLYAAGSASDNVIDIYGLPNTIEDVDEVTQIEVLVWYSSLECDGTPSGNLATIDIDLGGYQGGKTLEQDWLAGVDGWKTLTWAGLSGSQADLDGLEVKLSVGTLNDGKFIHDTFTIWSIYLKITYTAAAAGWAHKFLGVPAANIAKVNGVAIANIASIKGVDI